jgi:hypothetical protein
MLCNKIDLWVGPKSPPLRFRVKTHGPACRAKQRKMVLQCCSFLGDTISLTLGRVGWPGCVWMVDVAVLLRHFDGRAWCFLPCCLGHHLPSCPLGWASMFVGDMVSFEPGRGGCWLSLVMQMDVTMLTSGLLWRRRELDLPAMALFSHQDSALVSTLVNDSGFINSKLCLIVSTLFFIVVRGLVHFSLQHFVLVLAVWDFILI